MTKVIAIGEEQAKTTLKPIELLKCFQTSGDKFLLSKADPKNFKFVELIARGKNTSNEDLIFCYNEYRDTGLLFLSHFNDGIV